MIKEVNNYKRNSIPKIEECIINNLHFKELTQYISILINRIIISSKDNNRNNINLEIYLNLKCNLDSFKYISKNKSFYIELLPAEK